MTISDKIAALAKINDLDRLLLGLDVVRDEVRSMIRSKDAAFIDEVLAMRPTNKEAA